MTDDPNTYQINTRPPPPKGLSKTTRGLIGLGFLIAIGAAIGSHDDKHGTSTSSTSSTTHETELLPMRGQIYYAAHTLAGCEDAEAFDRLRQLMREDKEAAQTFWASRVDCRNIHVGTKVWNEDVSVWHGRACMREAGKTTCLWTLYGTLVGGKESYSENPPGPPAE